MSADDPRVKEAVELWKKAPQLTVEQVMLATKFMIKDSEDRRCQAWVRRRSSLKRDGLKQPMEISISSTCSTLSPMTASHSSSSTSTTSKLSGKKKLDDNSLPTKKEETLS